MAVKVGIDELMKSLQKAGVPFGNSAAMQGAQPGLGQAIQGQVYGQDTQLPELRSNYMSQLDQIHQMDKKLAGVYGDPSSQLYIENPMNRERVISGASNTGYKAVSGVNSRIKQRKSELDQTVTQALSYYKELTTLQAREEARAEKLAKEAERISSGKAKYVTDSKGNKVAVPVAKGKASKKTLEDKVKDSLDRAEEVKKQKLELAGIYDKKAGDEFLNAPKAFQDQFIRDYQSNKDTLSVGAGFGVQEVQEAVKNYKQTFKPTTEKKTAQDKQLEKIQALKQALGVK